MEDQLEWDGEGEGEGDRPSRSGAYVSCGLAVGDVPAKYKEADSVDVLRAVVRLVAGALGRLSDWYERYYSSSSGVCRRLQGKAKIKVMQG